MKNLTNTIDLQVEKLEAIKFLLKSIQTDNNSQSTSVMLRELQSTLYLLILNDF